MHCSCKPARQWFVAFIFSKVCRWQAVVWRNGVRAWSTYSYWNEKQSCRSVRVLLVFSVSAIHYSVNRVSCFHLFYLHFDRIAVAANMAISDCRMRTLLCWTIQTLWCIIMYICCYTVCHVPCRNLQQTVVVFLGWFMRSAHTFAYCELYCSYSLLPAYYEASILVD